MNMLKMIWRFGLISCIGLFQLIAGRFKQSRFPGEILSSRALCFYVVDSHSGCPCQGQVGGSMRVPKSGLETDQMWRHGTWQNAFSFSWGDEFLDDRSSSCSRRWCCYQWQGTGWNVATPSSGLGLQGGRPFSRCCQCYHIFLSKRISSYHRIKKVSFIAFVSPGWINIITKSLESVESE